MKNKNARNKLAFSKAVVTELNTNELVGVNGGTSGLTSLLPLSSFLPSTIIKN